MPSGPQGKSTQSFQDEKQTHRNSKVDTLRGYIANHSTLTVLCTILAACLLLLTYIATQPLPHYILVLDSGSTGTRIYAYIWKYRQKQLPILTPIEVTAAPHKVPRRQGGDTRAYDRVETEPGLGEYVENLAGVKENALGPLLAWALEVVPSGRHKDTPIFLFGTAGLRNLPKEQQDNVLEAVKTTLHDTPFRFHDPWARVLTGEWEGIYGWIALNYLSGHLAPHPLTAPRSVSQATNVDGAFDSLADGDIVLAASEELKTVGSLDLGGSSLEVTFIPMKLSKETITVLAAVSMTAKRRSTASQKLCESPYRHADSASKSGALKFTAVSSSAIAHLSHFTALGESQAKPFSHTPTTNCSSINALRGAAQCMHSLVPAMVQSISQPRNSTIRKSGSLDSFVAENTSAAANVSILGVQYGLYTQTHNEHGLNTAFDRTVDVLMKKPERLGRNAESQGTQAWGKNHDGLESSRTRKKGNLDYATGLQIAASKQRKKKKPPHLFSKDATNHKSATKLISRDLQSIDGGPMELVHPCLHEGYRKLHQIAPRGELQPASSVVLIGRPDWQACEQLVSFIIDSSQSCEQPPCALGASQPLTTQPMFALTGFYVVFHFFGLPPTATLEELEKKGRRFCDTDWNAIASNRGSEVHVESYCFRSLYVIKLLRQGLGLPEAQIRMGSGQEAWTLGAALAEGGRVGAGLELRPAFVPRIAVFLILAATLLVWSCVVGTVLNSSRNVLERKPSGHPEAAPTSGLATNRQVHHSLPPLPRNISTHSLQGGRNPSVGSPTAVVGGGDFNTNVARLSAYANQRKRVSSVDDLTSLR